MIEFWICSSGLMMWHFLFFILFVISMFFMLMTVDDIATGDWYLIPLSSIYIY